MSAAAARQRRYRDRLRAGRRCITLETDLGGLGDLLRDAGALTPLSEDDPETLARGLERLLETLKRCA